MLLTIDIGNTNLTFGVFEGEKLRSTFRLTTNIPRTSNEFGDAIVEGLSRQHISEATIEDVIIASVVPKVMYSLVSGIKKYFHCTPYVVGEGTKSGIHIAASNPSEIGADRIVDAVGAYDLYGGPVIVVDYGTATTYDLVTKDGVLRHVLPARELRSVQRRFGPVRHSFRRLRSRCRRRFLRKIRSPVCRQELCMARLARPSTLSERSKKNPEYPISK